MTLTLADFAPITDALTDNLPVIVAFIVTMAGLNYVIKLVKRHARLG